MRNTLMIMALPLCAGLLVQSAAADGGQASASSARSGKRAAELSAYFESMQKKNLLQTETAKVQELRSMLHDAEALALDDHHEDAALLLYEIVESPRFADYSELEEFDAARFALGSSLHALGAEASARHYLRLLIDEGPEGAYFGPAFRRYVDVALTQRDLTATVMELNALRIALPTDAQDELRYLRGRERFDLPDDAAASKHFAEVSRESRFYASAQYLLGAIAARQRRFSSAEEHFCRVASPSDKSRYALHVDQRYFEVKDLARLGLGRVAHEQGRSQDAFYYYFQVPEDSSRLPHAMFEAAYAMYEGGEHESSLDLIDQLQTRFPRSALADEASILQGYSALSGCEFEKASRLFTRFIETFAPVAVELDRILDNPARRQALYEELARSERSSEKPRSDAHVPKVRKTLLALLRVDPEFVELHERVRKLDAEAARAARAPELLELISARMAGGDRPRATSGNATQTAAELSLLGEELKEARGALRTLSGQLDTMRAAKASHTELRALEKELAALASRTGALEGRVRDERAAQLAARESQEPGIEPLLAHDIAVSRGFERRVTSLRPRLVAAANDKALVELRALRARLGGFLRRARIGRIDAIMGSKRRIEMQIESLAAGRFPAELRDPLRVQGFLADDEEYWPFEGEDWPDEFEENYDAENDESAQPTEAP